MPHLTATELKKYIYIYIYICSQVPQFYLDFPGRIYSVQRGLVMMPQKMLEQPLNWLGISSSMVQKRLVSLLSLKL